MRFGHSTAPTIRTSSVSAISTLNKYVIAGAEAAASVASYTIDPRGSTFATNHSAVISGDCSRTAGSATADFHILRRDCGDLARLPRLKHP